jgi:hypothetical protein
MPPIGGFLFEGAAMKKIGRVILYRNEKERKMGIFFFSSILFLYVFGNLFACTALLYM